MVKLGLFGVILYEILHEIWHYNTTISIISIESLLLTVII